MCINDLVLVSDETSPRGQWPLGRVVEVHPGKDGLVRSVVVRVGTSYKIRPVHKLCYLESPEAIDISRERKLLSNDIP